ncbi:MAG: iron chaperone [Thermoleophilia bacterium]
MQNYTAKDVDEYIASSDEEARPKLEELRKLTKATVPDAEEKISWGVPFYWYHGALVGFAAYTKHISYGLAFPLKSSERGMLEEKGYATGKKTMQIRFDQKVPATAIKQILKAQVKMNEAKKAKNKFKRPQCGRGESCAETSRHCTTTNLLLPMRKSERLRFST